MRRTPDTARRPAPTRIQAIPSGGERHEQAIREPGNTSMWGPGNPNRREARERERSALRAAPRTLHGNSTSTSIESTTTHTPRPRPAERLRRENQVQWARWLRHKQHRTDTVATPERRRDDQTGAQPHGAKRHRERTDRTEQRAPRRTSPQARTTTERSGPGRESERPSCYRDLDAVRLSAGCIRCLARLICVLGRLRRIAVSGAGAVAHARTPRSCSARIVAPVGVRTWRVLATATSSAPHQC